MKLSKYLSRLTFPIKRYKYSDINFISKLGEGSTGSVYKTKINSKYHAVKIFDIENYLNIDGLIDDVYNELYISDLLKNSVYANVFYGICVYNKLDDVKIYLISDYYKQSMDLRDFINKNYYEEKFTLLDSDKISIIKQLILALKDFTDKKVLHCDIKPENIIIYKKKNDYKIKFIDFTASCYLNGTMFDSSEYDYDFGTVGYMSKEVHNKKIYFSSEIYSLFVCILEIIVGKIWINGFNYINCRNEILNSLNTIKNIQIKNYIKLGLSEKHQERPTINNIYKQFILLQQLV